MAQLAPWLEQPADPGTALLKGAQAGSLIASSIQRGRALDLQAQQQAEASRMNEARMAEMKVEQQLKESAYTYMLQQRTAEAALASTFPEIGQLENGWANPKAFEMLMGVAKSNPAIISSQVFIEASKNARLAQEALAGQRQAEERNRILAQRADAYDDWVAKGGKNYAPTSAEKYEFAYKKAVEAGDKPAAENYWTLWHGEKFKQDAQRTRMSQSADRLRLQGAEAGVAFPEQSMPAIPPMPWPGQPAGSPAPAPAGPQPQGQPAVPVATPLPEGQAQGQAGATQPAPLKAVEPLRTKASITDLQKQIDLGEQAHIAIQRARAAIAKSPEGFGPLGGIREGLEAAWSFINPGQPMPVTEARAAARVTAEKLMSAMKQSGTVSDFERKQYLKVTEMTGMADTADANNARLKAIETGIAAQVIRASLAKNGTVPAWADKLMKDSINLTFYTEQELQDAVQKGLIDPEQALNEYRRRQKAK